MANEIPLRNGGFPFVSGLTVDDTSRQWTYNLASGADWVLQENGTEVGKYDGGDNTWTLNCNIAGGGVFLRQQSTDTGADLLELSLAASSPTSSAYFLYCYSNTSTFEGGIRLNAGVLELQDASDARLKTAAEPYTRVEALAQIMRPTIYRYERLGYEGEEVGFIWQDLVQTWPECAEAPEEVAADELRRQAAWARRAAKLRGKRDAADAGGEDAPAWTERDDLDLQAAERGAGEMRPGCVSTRRMIPVLVASVQALVAEVADLRARLETLEAG